MPVWEQVIDAVVALLALIVLYGIALLVRRRVLSRHGGTFELSYRVRSDRAGRGWVLGLGRYAGEQLEWFPVFSLSPRASRTWARSRLVCTDRREPDRAERMSLYPDHVIVRAGAGGEEFELALSRSSLMGLQSWLESRPPGAELL